MRTPAASISALTALAALEASRRSSSVRSGTHWSLKAMRYSVMSPPCAGLGPCGRPTPSPRTAAARYDTPQDLPASTLLIWWLRALHAQARHAARPAGGLDVGGS